MPSERPRHFADAVNGDCRARALIDAAALRHNLALARRLAPSSKIMAVVKSDAYGHGMAVVTRLIAERVDAFAVATLTEGIECRRTNPSVPITVLSGLRRSADLHRCRQHQLQPVVHTFEQVEWVEQYDGAPLSPWLKIDTGMNRLGVAPDEVADAIARLRRNRRVEGIRLMSHLANADDLDDDYTATQSRRFRECTDQYEMERSLANSAALMKWPQTHFQWVRPGIMLYGGSPLRGCRGGELGLRPVMQLESRLLSVKTIAAGQPVGYGGTFVTPAPMRIGVVGFGYGDGYPRAISPAAHVLIGDTRVPIIGRVSMGLLTLDLSGCEDAAVAAGSKVVLWGRGLGVDEVAEWAGSIGYELLSRVGANILRQIAEDGDGEI